MSTSYHVMETHEDGTEDILSLTQFCGKQNQLEPDRTRIQLTFGLGGHVALNRQQALSLAQKLLSPWTGEEITRVEGT